MTEDAPGYTGSPTQRTLQRLRAAGWVPWVVEHWHQQSRRRVDLFGLWDVLAVGRHAGETLAVQACAYASVPARVTKITNDEHAVALDACRTAGWTMQVWGWRKPAPAKGRHHWQLRVVDVS